MATLSKTLAAATQSERDSFFIPRSVQRSIPIKRIYNDGIFQVGRKYSRTWRFSDINYASASDEDQGSIFRAYSAALNALPTDATTKITIEITADDDMGSIAEKLQDAGLIRYKWFFRLFAAVTGASEEVGIGTYELNTDMDYHALIAGMRSSSGNLSAETVTVTIPEGYTVRQTIALLAEKGVNTEEALTEAAQTGDFDYDFIDNESEDLSRLEGFLFPDTYEFYVGHNAEDALDRLIRNFVSRMDEERMTQVEESSYSLQEIITIASLIEEETDGTDQANIASVIYNRLEGSGNKQGTYGLLQIDASLLYALPDHTGPITSADMQTDSPYNLYQNAGLPPTPISNPGLASIDAALNPNSTDYYYYALGTDGKHHFSTTLAEHNAFVNSSSYGG